METLNVGAADLADLTRALLENGATVRFTARGASMSPLIKDGDAVEVRPVRPGEPSLGDVVLYGRCGRLMAHRIVGTRLRDGLRSFLIKADAGRGVEAVDAPDILGLVTARIRGAERTALDRVFQRWLGLLASRVPEALWSAAYRGRNAARRCWSGPAAAPAPRPATGLKLTVSIVSWNVKGYLEKCLDSVFRHSGGADLEVIVVDNASVDGSAAMVRERFPQVRLIENKENVGYGRGHNQALERAAGEYVLFLNPDTEMLPDTLPRAVRFMDQHPEAGAAITHEIASLAQRGQACEIGVLLAGWRKALWDLCLKINRIAPNRWSEGFVMDTIAAWRAACKDGFFFSSLAYCEAGFLLCRGQALAQTGRFDPRFFLGEEGIDLTRRMKRLGWELYLIMDVHVIHHGGKSCEQLGDAAIEALNAASEEAARGGGAPAKLTVSIVNWNVKDYLDKCLDSVLRHAGGIDLEVIVVDNASADGSAAMVREKFPRVRLIENSENVGYGRGHNQALGLATGEYVLLLNPDTEMLPDTLPRTIRFMDRHPEAGAVQIEETVSPDRLPEELAVEVSMGFWMSSLWRLACAVERVAPNRWTGGFLLETLLDRRGRLDDGTSFIAVNDLESGFLLARREALRQTGGFDPRFILGHEGLDLTRRMKRSGWQLYFISNIHVVHYGKKSYDQLDQAAIASLASKGSLVLPSP